MIKENKKTYHFKHQNFKRYKGITMTGVLLILCLLLGACGNKVDRNTGAVSGGAVETVTEKESDETGQDMESTISEIDQYNAYEDIIKDYISFYKGEKPYDGILASSLIGDESSVMNYGSYDNTWLAIVTDEGYFDDKALEYMYRDFVSIDAKYYDANGDGVYEMFIVETDDGDKSDGAIHDVWTLIDGKPKYVDYFDARYNLIVTEDGRLIEYSSSGWNSNTCATLVFNSDGSFSMIDVVEEVSEEDNTSTFKHNGNSISDEEYSELTGEYYDQKRKNLTKLDGVTIASWKK